MRSIGGVELFDKYIQIAKELVYFKLQKPIESFCNFIMRKVFEGKELKNIIVFESHNDFDCNGGAIYDYLIRHGYNKKYKIVWLLKNNFVKNLPENVTQFNIYRPSIRKSYYLSNASYFFSDDIITDKIRKNQKSIYCSHGGCTFKNVKGLINISQRVDYVLSVSQNYDPYLRDNYSIPDNGVEILHLGLPKHDIMFRNVDELQKIVNEKRYKKAILWMPTFRKTRERRNDSTQELVFDIPLIENLSQYDELNKALEELDIVLIIKLHPAQDCSLISKLPNKSNIVILTGMDTKRLQINMEALMSNVDALISDYSSAAYSFLLLNRPLAFVLSDYEYYKRGFLENPPKNFLPGHKIYELMDLCNFIKEVSQDEDRYENERRDLREWMHEYKDGRSVERIVEYFNLCK